MGKFAELLTEARMPLAGHAYHSKSDDELRYIQKDAGEAAKAMKDHSPASESKYLDQHNDASTVLHYRSQGGKQTTKSEAYVPMTPEKKAEAVADLRASNKAKAKDKVAAIAKRVDSQETCAKNESMPQKRTFTVHAKDEQGKAYSYDHEAYSPRGIHKSEVFSPATPGGTGGKGHKLVSIKHNDKDVTNESYEDANESLPQKRTFKVSAKDHEGKAYSYSHEAYSPRGIHSSSRFEPATPGGTGGLGHKLLSIKHNGKDVTNESFELNEGVRKVGEHECGNRKATVHKDSDIGEFHVKFHTDGKHHADADYHTDDVVDAHGTAKHWVNTKAK